MSLPTSVWYGLVFVLVGTLALGYGLWHLRPVYHILTNDPIAVRDLVTHTGPAEVEGRARPTDEGSTVTAPFSDIECLACTYEAEELRSSGKNNYWKTLDEGAVAVPFLVEDETGSARVDPAGATLKFDEQVVTVPGGEEPPASIAQYINRTEDIETQHDETVNLVVTELSVGNDQRFVERRLDVEESVYVYGDVERAPAGEWGSSLVDARLTRGQTETMVVSDTSERGTAWRLARRPLLFVLVGVVALLPGLFLSTSFLLG